jgi:outer membrane autotransporter protein
VNSISDTVYTGSVSGSGGLTKSGGNTIALAGDNAYTGSTNVADGALALVGAGSIAHSSDVSLSSASARLDISATSAGATMNNLSGVSGSQVNLGAQTLTVNSNADTTYAGSLTGTGGLTKSGSSVLTLNSINSFSGATDVSAGTLVLSGAGSIAQSSGVNLSSANSTLDITGTTAGATLNNLSGVSDALVNIGAQMLVVNSTSDSVYDGNIVGTGSLTKSGSNTFGLTAAQSYTGATDIASGVLALNGAGSIAQSSGVNLSAATATLDISATSVGATVNNLSGNAGSLVALGSKTLTVNSNADTVFSGDIAGSGGLTKVGSGELTLSGVTGQTGDTHIDAGSLVLDGLQGGANLHSNVIAQSGTNLVIRNGANLTGWIDPTNVSIGSGSTWNMTNDSLVDHLTNNGTIEFQAMQNGVGKVLTTQGNISGVGKLVMNAQLGGTNPAHDQIVVSGGRVSGDQAIQVNNAGGQGSNATIRLVKVTNGGTVDSGAFRLANPGAKVSAGLYDYYLKQGDADSAYNQVLTPQVNSNASLGVPLAINAAQVYSELLVPTVNVLGSVLKDSDQLWVRGLYNQYKNSESSTVDSTNQTYGIQVGKDLYVDGDADGGMDKAGVYLAYGVYNSWLYGQVNGGEKANQGGNELINQSIGGYYVKKFANEFYASAVAQATRYGVTSNLMGGNSLNTTGFGYLASVEVGQPFEIYGKSLTVTPEAQVVVQQIQLNNTGFNGTDVQYSTTPIWTSRLGVKLATESEPDDQGKKSSAWMALNAYSTDGASPGATFSSGNGLVSSTTNSTLAGLVGGVQMGVTGNFSKSWSGNMTVNYTQGLQSSPVNQGLGIQGVLQYRFD